MVDGAYKVGGGGIACELPKRRWFARKALLHGTLPGNATRMTSAIMEESDVSMDSDPAGHSQVTIEPKLPNHDGFSAIAVRSDVSFEERLSLFSKAIAAKRCVSGVSVCP